MYLLLHVARQKWFARSAFGAQSAQSVLGASHHQHAEDDPSAQRDPVRAHSFRTPRTAVPPVCMELTHEELFQLTQDIQETCAH